MAGVTRVPPWLDAGPSAPGSVPRWLYLDNLKVVLIAAVIALHGISGYAGVMDAWTYTEMREVTLSPAAEIVLVVLALPFALVLMALLFLVSGLLTVPSVQRKGPGRFARDRLVRLGIPFAVYVLVVQPVVVYALEHRLGYASGSYWQEFLGDEGVLDTGPLWFVGVLLVYSLLYAGWVRLGHPASPAAPTVRPRHLVVTAVVVAVASFLVRLVYPYGSDAGVTDLNFWQWPACIAAFGLGVVAARQGWTTEVPDGVRRTSRAVTLAAAPALASLMVVAGLTDRVGDMAGGLSPPAAAFAALDALLCLFGSVWLLAVAQRRLTRPLPHGTTLARSAYAAFVVQTPVLIALALALRGLALPAEVKALLVAAGGVSASFGLAWVLLTRVPGVARIL
jgi:hypothetical protein